MRRAPPEPLVEGRPVLAISDEAREDLAQLVADILIEALEGDGARKCPQ